MAAAAEEQHGGGFVFLSPCRCCCRLCVYVLQALLRADPEAGVAVLVHELTHALGFTDDMFDKFIDSDGQPIPKSQVTQKYVDPYDRTTAMVITPTVVREVRAQFGCDTLPGAALENEGGQGSANAHWEYRWFQVRLVCPDCVRLHV